MLKKAIALWKQERKHKGTTLHVWNVDVRDTSGDLISNVRVTNYIIKSKK